MMTMVPQLIINATGLLAAFLFMLGLKRMSSPVTAPSGIFVAGVGMLVAVLASFLYVFGASAETRAYVAINAGLAAVALLVGGGVAFWSGKKAAMTSMPQMVALYNGMGGGAAGSIAAVELFGNRARGATPIVVTLLGALIGAVSFSGSLIAWAKLEGLLKKPARIPGQQLLNAIVLFATLAVGGYMVFASKGGETPMSEASRWIALFFGGALILGVLMTLPVGGADMPVVISVYNACTGLAVSLEGTQALAAQPRFA